MDCFSFLSCFQVYMIRMIAHKSCLLLFQFIVYIVCKQYSLGFTLCTRSVIKHNIISWRSLNSLINNNVVQVKVLEHILQYNRKIKLIPLWFYVID